MIITRNLYLWRGFERHDTIKYDCFTDLVKYDCNAEEQSLEQIFGRLDGSHELVLALHSEDLSHRLCSNRKQ